MASFTRLITGVRLSGRKTDKTHVKNPPDARKDARKGGGCSSSLTGCGTRGVTCEPNWCHRRSDPSSFLLSLSFLLFSGFSAFLRPKLGKQYEASCVVSSMIILGVRNNPVIWCHLHTPALVASLGFCI